MKLRYSILPFLLLCLFSVSSYSQLLPENQLQASTKWIAKMGLGYDRPSADLAERFGANLNFHMGLERLSIGNWVISSDFTYRFGSDVKEDVLANFRLPIGQFLSIDGLPSDAFLRSRGASLRFSIGKIIGLHEKSPQSGIRIDIGVGLLSHYIRVQDENQAIDQIFGEYKNVYDRLTRGFAMTQYVGYQYLSTDGFLNFNIGFEFNQAFTSGVRSVDYTTNTPKQTGRRDFLNGLKITWLIPFYSDEQGEQIYY